MIRPFRPWGLFPWVLEKSPKTKWSIYGTLATEERCLSAFETLLESGHLAQAYMAKIIDPPSKYSSKSLAKQDINLKKYLDIGGDDNTIHPMNLMENYSIIVDSITNFITDSGDSIVVDISALPKQYFFPILKVLYRMEKDRVKNLIVTYTIPEKYAEGDLAEDYQDWMRLPLFTGKYSELEIKLLVAGVGFMTMGLPDEVDKTGGSLRVKLLFPFPPGPPSFSRNWEFVRMLEKNLGRQMIEIKHVNARDTSDAFNHIVTLTDNGNTPAIFAPYGPKPISLAMCLFSILTDSPVYYTQPRVYNPDYSFRVSMIDGKPEIYAYCLRLNGRDIYKI